jgi:hypothetical protein
MPDDKEPKGSAIAPGGPMTPEEKRRYPALRVGQIGLGLIALAFFILAAYGRSLGYFALTGAAIVALIVLFVLANAVAKGSVSLHGQLHTFVWGVVILAIVAGALGIFVGFKPYLFDAPKTSEKKAPVPETAPPERAKDPVPPAHADQPVLPPPHVDGPVAPFGGSADAPLDGAPQAKPRSAPDSRRRAPSSVANPTTTPQPTTVNVTSNNQTGGITAGTVNVTNGPRPPSYEVLELSQPTKNDAGYEWAWRFKITADVPVPKILLAAFTATAASPLHVERDNGMTMAMMVQTGPLPKNQGVFYSQEQVGPGTYIARVTTTAASPAPKFELTFPGQ